MGEVLKFVHAGQRIKSQSEASLKTCRRESGKVVMGGNRHATTHVLFCHGVTNHQRMKGPRLDCDHKEFRMHDDYLSSLGRSQVHDAFVFA